MALLQETSAHMQQEQHSLRSHLATQEQSLTQKQTKNSEIKTHLVQLRHDKQLEEQHAQVCAKLGADAIADHSSERCLE